MKFDFFDLSKYRTQIMGISILLIMLFHTYGDGNGSRYNFFSFGFVGVEFFLLVSAIGLFFSLTQNSNLKVFFRKRFIRILPAYFIVSLPYFAYEFRTDFSWQSYIINLSGLGIFDKVQSFWFIGHIIVCYLLMPFYYRLLRYKYSFITPFVVLVACFFIGRQYPIVELFINRFAIFFLGLHLAQWVYEKKQIQGSWIHPLTLLATILVIVVGDLLIKADMKRVSFFFLSIPALIFVTLSLKRSHYMVKRVFSFMGSLTLEIYLLHGCIVLPLCHKLLGTNFGDLSSIPISIFVAYILSCFIKMLIKV